MGSPDQKNKPSLWRDLAAFAAVAAFCVYSGRAVLKSRPSSAEPASSSLVSRKTAAIDTGSKTDEKSTKIIEIGCLGPGTATPVITGASLIRVMANECATAANVSAKNETTGESLLVFQRSKQISTHYFPLKIGKNRVVIEWLDPKGIKASKKIEVERQASGT